MVKMLEFRIHFATQFGKALYLTGDSDILGNWDPKKAIRMNWSEGNIWKFEIQAHNFQYKYFVANYDDAASDVIWEPGPNRAIFQHQKTSLKILDFWNYREVQFYCNNPQNHQVYITGSAYSLTLFKQFKKMNHYNNEVTFNILINPCNEKVIKFRCQLNNQEDLMTEIETVCFDDQNQYKNNVLQIKCQLLDALIKQLEEEQRRIIEEKRRIEEERRVQEERRIQEQRRIEEERKRVEQENIRKQQEEKGRQIIQQDLQPVSQQIQTQQEIRSKPVQQQIQILSQELNKLDYNNNLTNNQKQYLKSQYQQQLIAKLKDYGEAKSIPHVRQNIETSNPEVALFVLKESLLRDQNIALLATSRQYSFGFDSILGSYGQDQSCLKVRNTNLDYDKIVNDNRLLQHHLLEFKQKLSSSLNISTDQIEILGVSKGSFEISFNITGNDPDSIQQQIKNNPNAKKFLDEYCNGRVEYVAYFDRANNQAKEKALSFDDFNPSHNMSWDGFHEKEQRGPPYHKYDYYFPRGCYGFGLRVKNYGNDDWIKMDGNPNEWRIMYHGTKQVAVRSITKDNLKPGKENYCAKYDCLDEDGKTVKVGNGIYFSNDFKVCINDGYASYTQIGSKQFAVIFMSRVNPKKVRHGGNYMRDNQYFVVNESQDVRPYRILLHEKK
ncbi:unnamed protein product [Paramecium octaurelia]|uniref:CBM20 domain-containing protein n=1 Tax=Paramecium octaurelia TaxID=43137 RepID=A0A8S1Y7C7_PAROT|nr:unnamed protein product [Paramecium octaurelia]